MCHKIHPLAQTLIWTHIGTALEVIRGCEIKLILDQMYLARIFCKNMAQNAHYWNENGANIRSTAAHHDLRNQKTTSFGHRNWLANGSQTRYTYFLKITVWSGAPRSYIAVSFITTFHNIKELNMGNIVFSYSKFTNYWYFLIKYRFSLVTLQKKILL